MMKPIGYVNWEGWPLKVLEGEERRMKNLMWGIFMVLGVLFVMKHPEFSLVDAGIAGFTFGGCGLWLGGILEEIF